MCAYTHCTRPVAVRGWVCMREWINSRPATRQHGTYTARQAWGLPAEEVSFLQADADVALDVAPAAVHGEVGLEGLVAEEAVARCLAEDELVHDGSRLGRVHDRHGE